MTELKKEKEGKKLWYGDKESEKYEKYLHRSCYSEKSNSSREQHRV